MKSIIYEEEKKLEVLQYEFEMRYPVCDHVENQVANSKNGVEHLAKSLFEKQRGLCAKCYSAYCKRNDIVPWYSK